MRETVQGMAAELLATEHPSMANVSGRLVEKLLREFSTISGPRGSMALLADVVAKKGFTRSQFTALLTQLSKVRPITQAIDDIIGDLKAEGVPARTAERIRQEAVRLHTEMARRPECKDALHWKTAVQEARKHQTEESYFKLVDVIVGAVKSEYSQIRQDALELSTLRALALLAINHVDEELASSSPESQNKTV